MHINYDGCSPKILHIKECNMEVPTCMYFVTGHKIFSYSSAVCGYDVKGKMFN